MSTEDAALKAAKKSLKRQDSGQMKLKHLARTVADQHEDFTVSNLKQLIRSSDKFHVDDKKIVTLLKRKRSKVSDDNNSNSPGRAQPKSATRDHKTKKSRTNKKVTAASSVSPTPTSDSSIAGPSQDLDSVQTWRRDNKIVILHAQDDEDGTKQSAKLQKDSRFFPCATFDQCTDGAHSLHAALIRHCVTGNGFTKPSPIQAQAWPLLSKQRDVVGIAETGACQFSCSSWDLETVQSSIFDWGLTRSSCLSLCPVIIRKGSGKTLAFALPLLSAMAASNKSKQRSPSMLVLSPTRELAMQSDVVIQEFGAVVGLQSLVVYGGVPKHTQVKALQRGNVDCLVATPGRLKDLMQDARSCDLSRVQYLVLDEADRMLDKGFEEEVRYIIAQCQQEGRQTAMFSATWPAEIQRLALDFMVDPVRVYVGFESIVGSNGENNIDDSLSANKRVTQTVEVIEDRQRERRLREILQKVHGKKRENRVLIFALYKKEAERLEMSLQRDGWKCCSIHGNKNQRDRTTALAQFKDGSCPLMVATDVAARGLDIPNVETVINYTFPLTIEDYVHRIGRTGRAGRQGASFTFFQPTDKSHAGELQQVLRQVGQPVPEDLAKFGSTIKKKEHKLYGNFGPKDGPMKKATKITFNYDSE